MGMSMILSIDIGTSSLKAGLLDVQTGRWVDTSSRPIETVFCGDRAEQDARSYESALLAAVDELSDRRPSEVTQVSAIGVTGQMRTVVLVGRNHEPLGPALTLYDRRASAEAADFLRSFGMEQIYRLTGQRFDLASTPAKLRWLAAHEPQRLRSVSKFLAPKDYVRGCLTDECATDATDAAGWLLYDLQGGRWQKDLAGFGGISLEQLPEIRPACDVAGPLLPELRRRWGIAGEALVAVGAGDDVAATGCGAVEPGDLYEHLGSTGSLFAVTNHPLLDEQCILECYPTERPDRFWVGGSFNGAGKAIEKALSVSAFSPEGTIDWARVRAAVARWPEWPAASRPLFLPYLAGERCPIWDARIRGAWLNLSVEQSVEDLAIAIHEGPALLLAWIGAELARLIPQTGPIYSAGKGGEDECYGRLRATIYGRPVHRTDHADAALLGAALIAGVAGGHWPSVADGAARCLRSGWRAEPTSELVDVHQDRLSAFQANTRALLHAQTPA